MTCRQKRFSLLIPAQLTQEWGPEITQRVMRATEKAIAAETGHTVEWVTDGAGRIYTPWYVSYGQ